MTVVGGSLQVCRSVEGDGMLLQDDGGVCSGLDTIQDDRLATLQPKPHVLLPDKQKRRTG